jgi:hypothetical protein
MEMDNKKIMYAVAGVATLGLLFLLYKKSSAQVPQLPNRTISPPITPIQEVPDISDMPGDSSTKEPKVDLKGLMPKPTMADLSNLLYDAFNGYGTTWKDGQFGGVYGVFSQLQSDDDFDSLNEYYGIREVSSGALNLFKKDYAGDMNSTMNDELTKREIRLINQLLEENGVSRRITINA